MHPIYIVGPIWLVVVQVPVFGVVVRALVVVLVAILALGVVVAFVPVVVPFV